VGVVIIDLFAGPGGWSEGLRTLGRTDEVGLEWDDAACKTAKAAGHQRIRCDVTTYPTDAFGHVEGLIGSPSCTLFSAAGNGVGNLVTHILAAGIVRMMAGDDCRAEIREAIYPTTLAMREAANAKRKPAKRWTQERVEARAKEDAFVACLVLEPARYILALGVEWVALEQVPEVLPLWKVYVRELRALGYSAWTGVLNSADYGVPQTRERAILMAHKSMVVHPPEPTHAEHPHAGADLFGGQLEKWVSMATALGWDAGLVGFPRRGDIPGEDYRSRDMFPTTGPSQVVTEKTRSWTRMGDKPAPTLTTTRRSKDGMLVGRQLPPGEGENVGGRNWLRMTTMPNTSVRHVSEPAPTIAFGKDAASALWCYNRPATTVVGSFCPDVISAPGYRTQVSRQNAEGGVRVTVAEGGVLQSFPPDYPWQGSRTKQYQQVGNAIPPRLAMHVLAALGVGTLTRRVA
jgi:DNA (cytosine-5)-methyltransferase 1